MKNALIVASVASMIDQFNRDNINLLKDLGYKVSVACNFNAGNTCSSERIIKLKQDLNDQGVDIYQLDFERNILKISGNIKAYNQLKRISQKYKFDIVHCHSPIGGLITRLVFRKSRKTGTRVLYTAHGFHFYKGASLKNWLLYYPVEKFCSKYTDVLITINQEDFLLAKKSMHAKSVEYIHGIGINLNKFNTILYDADFKNNKRKELNISADTKVFLSVGELIPRKNHKLVIEALKELKNDNVIYLICGKGADEYKNELENLINLYELEDKVKLLGFRTDIAELCSISDLFIFPSIQEGLPVALMEAIAMKVPAIGSNIRGNKELLKNEAMFDSKSPQELLERIRDYSGLKNLVEENYTNLLQFDVTKVMEETKKIYGECK